MRAILNNMGAILINVGAILTRANLQWGDLTVVPYKLVLLIYFASQKY
jgi:hypothetical protein